MKISMNNRSNAEIAKEKLRGKVITGLSWTFMGRVSSQLITWVITFLVIRILLPEDYGLKSMAEVCYSMAFMLSSAGIGTAVIQAKEITERTLQQIFTFLMLFNLGLALLLNALAVPIAWYYHEPRVTPILMTLSLGFLVSPFITMAEALLSREMRFKKISLSNFIANITASISTLSMALLGAGVWALVIGPLVGNILNAILLNKYASWPKKLRLDFRESMDSIRFGGTVTLASLIWYAYVQMDIVIAGRAWDVAQVGVYAVAIHLASMPMNKVMPLLNQIAFPAYSRLQHDPSAIRWYFLKSVRIVAFVLFPLSFGLAVVSVASLPLLLGEKWQAVAFPLCILSFGIPLRALNTLPGVVTRSLGRPMVDVENATTGFLILLPAFAIGVLWGEIGLALAWTLAFPLVFLQNAKTSLQVFQIPLWQMLQQIKPPLLCATLMCVILFWCIQNFQSFFATWFGLVFLITFGGSVYCGSMWFLYRHCIKEFVAMKK